MIDEILHITIGDLNRPEGSYLVLVLSVIIFVTLTVVIYVYDYYKIKSGNY